VAERPVVLALDVLPEASRAIIRERFSEYTPVFATSMDRDELLGLARDATVFLSSWGRIDAGLIAAAPRLRVIQKLGVGVDKFDLDAARERGVIVLKAAGINAEAVAELAVLLTFAVSRNLMKAVRLSREGRFEKEVLRAESTQILGRTVGLYGFGHIGRAVARRFQSFGASIIYYDPFRLPEQTERELGVRFVEFDTLLRESDVVSIHAPSTPETNGVFGAAAFAVMKRTAILVNTARGELVDDHALADALIAGRLRGAGLDVIANEPISPDSPLFDLDQVIVTPHIGGAVGDNFPRVVARALENVDAALAGASLRPADVVVGPPADK
jgi:phosphoglycerate dehydrogenase-like enzyme